MRHKLSGDKKKKIRDIHNTKFEILLRKCVRFAADNLDKLNEVTPSIPDALNDRAADNWTPLLAIANLAGENWLQKSTDAAIHLWASEGQNVSIEIELLQDIKNIFEEKNYQRLSTTELIDKLCEDNESPWVTFNRGNPLTARQLAKRLSPFGIHSKDIRTGQQNKTLKGYIAQEFTETFERYIPPPSPDDAHISATTQQSTNEKAYKEFHMRDKSYLPPQENHLRSSPELDCRVVADKSEVMGK